MTSTQDTKAVAIQNKQTLAIAPNDISLIDDETQITRILVKNDVSQTIAFKDVQDKIDANQGVTVSTLSDVFSETDTSIDQGTLPVVDGIIGTNAQDKKIISPDQNSQLRNILYAEFLLQDIKSLYSAYREADNETAEKNIRSLEDKLLSLYRVFGIDIPVNTATTLDQKLSYIKTIATELKKNLTTKYYVPPRYIANIETIAQRATYIADQ